MIPNTITRPDYAASYHPQQRLTGLYDSLMLALIVMGGFLWALSVLSPERLLSDEGFHWIQVGGFLGGEWFIAHNITVLPAYHLTIASIMNLLGLETVTGARYVNWWITFPALALFYWMVRSWRDGNPSALTLQFFLSPILFPFFFLVFTDMFSATLLLFSLFLTLERHYRSAAIIAGISILFRQSNVVWLVLFWLLALHDAGFFRQLGGINNLADIKSLKFGEFFHALRKTYLFPVFCLLFAIFVYINKGVAVGDADMHTLRMPHVTQLFLFLFYLFLLFIPLHIKNTPAILRLMLSKPILPFLCAVIYAVYILTFDASHNYNKIDFFLRNKLIIWLHESYLNRSLAFIAMLWALCSLAVTPLRERKYYWLYPVAALSLLPVGMIEQRYFMVPLILFMLFRRPESDRLEYLTATLYIPVTMFLFVEMSLHTFFL